jgi:hypothetical protein
MAKANVIDVVPPDLVKSAAQVTAVVESFAKKFDPLELQSLYVLIDPRINARYTECHVRASKLISLSTIDVPLDPEDQADYRANRGVVEDSIAFESMKKDALARRTFSNIVAEYTESYDADHPLVNLHLKVTSNLRPKETSKSSWP